MNYLIGIDGGGTGSRCVITDYDANVLYRCNGGPTNFLRYEINEVCKTIYTLLNNCRKSLRIDFDDIKALVIGTAGAGRKNEILFFEKKLRKYLRSKRVSIKFIKVLSDGLIALEGAISDGEGCILISGTGSIIFGKNNAGEYFRLGGYGRKIGDEGSGYLIGRKGLNAVSQDFDGRGEKTLLTSYLQKNFIIKSGHELITNVYKEDFNVPSFAPFVIKAAAKKDKVAKKILYEEANELTNHIVAMKKLMKIKKIKVAFSGSLITGKNYYSDLLKRKIRSSLTGVEIIRPENPPEIGAILVALKHLNFRTTISKHNYKE
jgi:N-acetylglucosamine kinase-like BadF-type ATPase